MEHFGLSSGSAFCTEKVTDTVHLTANVMTLRTIHMNPHCLILYKADMYLVAQRSGSVFRSYKDRNFQVLFVPHYIHTSMIQITACY